MATEKKSIFFEGQKQKENFFVSDSIAEKIDISTEFSVSDNYISISGSHFPIKIVSIKNKNNKLLVSGIVKMPTFTQFIESKNSDVLIDGTLYKCELKSLNVLKKNSEDGLLTISVLNA